MKASRWRRSNAPSYSGAPGWSEILGRPDWIHALLLQWDGELEAARERLQALRQDAVNRGDEHSLPSILFQLARVELLTGDWERARRHGIECYETTLHSGQAGERPYALTIQALVDAHLGLVEPAWARIDEGLALARQLGVQSAEFELLATRGLLELSLADARQADRTFSELAAMVKAFGFGEPALFRFHSDAIEAKIALGDRREAQALLEDLEQVGAALQRPWVLAVAGRCRGLLSAADGDLGASYRAIERALELHGRLGEPFEHARTLLVLGSVQRRDRKKSASRESLGAALEIFDTLGAAVWASRTRGGAGACRRTGPGGGPDADRGAHRQADRLGPYLPGDGRRHGRHPGSGSGSVGSCWHRPSAPRQCPQLHLPITDTGVLHHRT